jgi:large-conductance mechanosensitive channel
MRVAFFSLLELYNWLYHAITFVIVAFVIFLIVKITKRFGIE